MLSGSDIDSNNCESNLQPSSNTKPGDMSILSIKRDQRVYFL